MLGRGGAAGAPIIAGILWLVSRQFNYMANAATQKTFKTQPWDYCGWCIQISSSALTIWMHEIYGMQEMHFETNIEKAQSIVNCVFYIPDETQVHRTL